MTRSNPQLSVDNLKQDTEYQFRFTPVSSDNNSNQENNASHLSLVLDVKTPSRRKGRCKNGHNLMFLKETTIHVCFS